MTGTFREVVAPHRLVFSSTPLDDDGNPMFEVLTTVAFEDHGGKTKLTVQARVVKATPEADQYLDGMEAGWTQSLERLEEILKS